MSRTRILFIIGALAICLAAFTGGRAAGRLLRPEAADAAGTRSEVIRLLRAHYYHRVDPRLLDGRKLAELPWALGDPYTTILSPAEVAQRDQNESGHYAGIGVHLTQEGDGVYVDDVRPRGPAAQAGIRRGDVVTGLDGRSVAALDVDALGERLRGDVGSRVAVEVRRGAQRLRFALQRRELPLTLVRAQLAGGTGVIGITEFADGTSAKVRAAVRRLRAQGARRLVLDLRRNPGGLVTEAVATAGAFLPRGAVVVREWGVHQPLRVSRTHAKPLAAGLPLAVLIDGESASAAEIVAGALHDHGRGILVGSRTFGKGVVQNVIPLETGGELKLTIAEDRTPAGTVIHHRGLPPDVVSYDDPRTPADDVLARAVGALRARG